MGGEPRLVQNRRNKEPMERRELCCVCSHVNTFHSARRLPTLLYLGCSVHCMSPEGLRKHTVNIISENITAFTLASFLHK